MNLFNPLLAGIASLLLVASCTKETGSTPVAPPVVPPTTTPPTTGPVLYVVATTGSDGNPGTESRPFATLQKAAQVAIAGSTVLVKAGTYVITSPIMPANSGTEASPIIYQAEAGADVVIDGQTKVPADKVGGLFFILNKSWIVVDGLTFRNSRRDGVQVRNSTGITVKNCTTFNTYASGIVAAGSAKVSVLNNRIQRACQDPEKVGTNECLTIASTTDFEVAGNTVFDRMFAPGAEPNNGGEGIDCKNSCANGKVHHNTVYDLYRTGIYIDAYEKDLSNVEVYANTVYNAANGISVASEEGGVLTGVRIHDNLIHDCLRVGIRLSGYLDNGPLRDLEVYQNTVTRCGFGTTGTWENVGLLIEADNPANRNFTIRNNIFAGNAHQIRTKNQPYATVTNNLVFGPTYAAGTGSLTAEPLFVNAPANDFRLKPGAPGIDKATGTPVSTADRRDQPRPVDGDGDGKAVADLGALEYKP